MKIAINSLGVNGGGGQTYIENFLPELQKIDQESDYWVLVRRSALHKLPNCGPHIRYVPVDFVSNIPNRFFKEQLWLPHWLKKEKIDLLFSPADSTSLLSPCPVVLAMRNMNLYTSRDKGWDFSFKVKFSALSTFARWSSMIAKKIIFVSRFSQKSISDTLNISNEKQRLVYHGVSPIFFNRCDTIPSTIDWINTKLPYILSVSSIYRYKNFVRLIKAFSLYRKNAQHDFHLIIAGSPFDKPYHEEILETIRKEKLEARVYLANQVSYQDLPGLYQHASLFAFPSYLETFGHPLVEAMASEIPIIAADIDNSREITDGSAIYFDPYDINSMANAMASAMDNAARTKELVAKGKARAQEFSWERCARETLSVFQEAVKG